MSAKGRYSFADLLALSDAKSNIRESCCDDCDEDDATKIKLNRTEQVVLTHFPAVLSSHMRDTVFGSDMMS